MKSLLQMETSFDLLKSFSVGQGKTDSLPEIASLEDGTLSYSGVSVEVTPVWCDSYLLANLHRNLKDLSPAKQREMLQAFSENRLSLNHRLEAQPVTSKPVASHLLTSDTLLNSYFDKVSPDQVRAVFDLLISANSSMTKDSLLSIVSTAANLIVSGEQLEAVKALETKEKGLILARNSLETVGARNVTFINDTTVSCSVGYALAEQLPSLVAASLEHVPAQDKLGVGCLVMTFTLKGE